MTYCTSQLTSQRACQCYCCIHRHSKKGQGISFLPSDMMHVYFAQNTNFKRTLNISLYYLSHVKAIIFSQSQAPSWYRVTPRACSSIRQSPVPCAEPGNFVRGGRRSRSDPRVIFRWGPDPLPPPPRIRACPRHAYPIHCSPRRILVRHWKLIVTLIRLVLSL